MSRLLSLRKSIFSDWIWVVCGSRNCNRCWARIFLKHSICFHTKCLRWWELVILLPLVACDEHQPINNCRIPQTFDYCQSIFDIIPLQRQCARQRMLVYIGFRILTQNKILSHEETRENNANLTTIEHWYYLLLYAEIHSTTTHKLGNYHHVK